MSETVIDDLFQQGSAKIRFVSPERHQLFEAVLINTSGGMTDGDEFSSNVTWGQNTSAIVTTQACERYYKSIGKPAKIINQLNVSDNAIAFWLPQEGIMFDGANYERNTSVSLEKNARLLAIESSVFGRLAMGESIKTGQLKECWKIRTDERLVFADTFALDGYIAKKLDQPAIAAGARAISTIIYVGCDNEAYRDEINTMINNSDIHGCATSFEQLTITRLFAPTAHVLRNDVTKVLGHVMERMVPDTGNSSVSLLPKVWSL